MIASKPLLRRLTGKAWRSKQIEALTAMRVPFTVRPDGEILVAEEVVKRLLGVTDRSIIASEPEPNWSALAEAT